MLSDTPEEVGASVQRKSVRKAGACKNRICGNVNGNVIKEGILLFAVAPVRSAKTRLLAIYLKNSDSASTVPECDPVCSTADSKPARKALGTGLKW